MFVRKNYDVLENNSLPGELLFHVGWMAVDVTLPGPPVVVVVTLPRYHLTMLNVQVQGHHHFRHRKIFLAHDFHQHRPFNVAKIGVLATAPGRRQPKQIVVFAPLVQQFFLGDGGFGVIRVFVISNISNATDTIEQSQSKVSQNSTKFLRNEKNSRNNYLLSTRPRLLFWCSR
jgi:hypothetical protein